MAPYAVVGATGQIGQELVRLLRDAGEEVRALVRDQARARGRLPADVELIEGDMLDAARLAMLLNGVKGLFVVSSDPATELGVYDAAGMHEVPVVVKSSAIGFGHAPPAGHAEAEAALMRHPVNWVVLRPNAFMQTLRSYLPALVEPDGSFPLPAGDSASAWVDTRDIAAVAATMLRRAPQGDGRVLTVTGPEALTMNEVATVIGQHLGRTLRYEPVPLEEGRRRLQEHLGPMGAFLAEHYSRVAAGGFAAVSDTVPRILGRPARGLDAFVAEDPSSWTPRRG